MAPPAAQASTPLIFETDACSGRIEASRADIHLTLLFKDAVVDNTVEFLAPAPPDYRESFTGSGLPFANKAQAFSQTPNRGTAVITQGEAHIHLLLPNSYYDDDGFDKLVAPYVDIMYKSALGPRHFTIQLGNAVPYRSLTYPAARTRDGVMFYDGNWDLPVRTQEQILLASAYPEMNQEAPNFWGDKPRQ
jgi:hypothetical protein